MRTLKKDQIHILLEERKIDKNYYEKKPKNFEK